MHKLECIVCKKSFTSQVKHAKYCCSRCRERAKYRKKSGLPVGDNQQLSKPQSKKVNHFSSMEIHFTEIHHLLALINYKLEVLGNPQPTITPGTEVYNTPDQVMNILSIKRTTLDRYTKDGILRLYRVGSRKVYYKRSDIDKLFEC